MSELLTPEELENRLFNVTKRLYDGDVAALRGHIEALTEKYDEACEQIMKDAIELSRQDEEIERLREFETWKKELLK